MTRCRKPILILLAIMAVSISHAQYQTKITVAQDSTGDFTSIQDAIDETKSFPDKQITIFVKNGTYKEKVKLHSWNTHVLIEGESSEGVIITWDDHFSKIDRGRNSTFMTYTFHVAANDVTLKNLTIRNTAGPIGQALALSVEGDRVKVVNCSIEGHQDTLYIAGQDNRQYFKNCLIKGSTDFIFGNATVFFEKCEIHSLSNSYITAASTEEDSNYGFVFSSCKLTAAEGIKSVYLGRPWRAFAKTVFVNCELGNHIRSEGWQAWSNRGKELTTFYAELNNTGTGANTSERVHWSKQLSKKELSQYDRSQVLSGWNLD